jgi:hypothetical protein
MSATEADACMPTLVTMSADLVVLCLLLTLKTLAAHLALYAQFSTQSQML